MPTDRLSLGIHYSKVKAAASKDFFDETIYFANKHNILYLIDASQTVGVYDIDLKDIIASTKYGKEGIGGIITKGTMYMGYPR